MKIIEIILKQFLLYFILLFFIIFYYILIYMIKNLIYFFSIILVLFLILGYYKLIRYEYIFIIIIIILLLQVFNSTSLYIAPSNIHGVGIFTKLNLFTNKKIYKAINKNKNITYFGSKINHSNNPNTYLKETNNCWYVYSLNYIKKYSELTLDYNNTPDFIMKPDPNWK